MRVTTGHAAQLFQNEVVLVEKIIPGHVERTVAGKGQADHAVENIDRGRAQVEGFICGAQEYACISGSGESPAHGITALSG